MAYDQNFDGFPLGATGIPFDGGAWVSAGSVFTSEIKAGGPTGSGKYWHLFGDVEHREDHTACTLWFAQNLSGRALTVVIRNSVGFSVRGIVEMTQETDSTVTLSIFAGQKIENTRVPIEFNRWNMYQINVQLQAVVVSGVPVVKVFYGLAVNGTTYITGAYQSTLPVASLPSGILEVNSFFFTTGNFDDITVDSIATLGTFPHTGAPKARISQGTVEYLVEPSTALARVSQGVIEVGTLPNTAKARVSEGVIELILGTGSSAGGSGWQLKEA